MKKVKGIALLLVAAFAAAGLPSCASRAKCTCPNFRNFRSVTGSVTPPAEEARPEAVRL